jgi:PAS domain S-box-containing protein
MKKRKNNTSGSASLHPKVEKQLPPKSPDPSMPHSPADLEYAGRYRSLIENTQVGYAYCKMLFENQQPQDFIYLDVNRTFESLTGLEDVVGKKVTEIIPGIKETNPEWFEIYGRVASTGQSEKLEGYIDALKIWLSVSVYCPEKGCFIALFTNITEQKRAEVVLRESEERYRSVISSMAEGVMVHDASGEIISCNASAEAILGLSADQIKGKTLDPLWHTVHEDGSPFPGETHPASLTLQNGAPYTNVIMGIYLPDASLRWVSINSQPIFLPGSARPAGVVATFIDITSHRQAIDQVLFQAHLLGEVRQAVIATDLDGHYLYWNRTAEDLFGARAEDVLGKINTDFFITDSSLLASTVTIREAVLATGSWKGELQARDRRGNPLVLESTVSLLRDKDGQARGFVSVIEEISRRKQAEEELHKLNEVLEQRVQERTVELQETNRHLQKKITELELTQKVLNESQTQYRIVADNTFDWEYWVDPNGSFIYSSPSCENTTGHKSQEFLDDPTLINRLVHPEDRLRFQQHHFDVLQMQNADPIEFRFVRKDGSIGWIEHVCKAVFDDQGCFLGTRGSNRDITERKRAEEALRESEEKLRLVINNIQDLVFVIDRDYKPVLFNPVFTQALRSAGHTMTLGKMVFSSAHPQEVIDLWKDNYERALAGETVHMQAHIMWEDGWHYFDNTLSPLTNPDQQVSGVLVVTHDITALKRAEQEIQKQAQRAEALVRTAAQFNANLDLDAVLNTICQQAMQALNASASDVRIYDEQRAELVLAASSGFSANKARPHLPVPRWDYDRMVSQFGTACIISDIKAFPNLTNAALYENEKIYTIMLASIFLDQKLVGVLSVFSRDNTQAFNSDDLSLLKALANQAAQAISNARLFEQSSANQKRLSALSQALVEAQEKERRALALELHDEFGQILSSMKMSLDIISPGITPSERAQFERAQTLGKNLIERVRRLALGLRPSLLDDYGLFSALNWLFNDYQKQTGQVIQFEQTGLEKRFPPMVEISAYRIVQEALTNIIRHAGNLQVYVHIWADEETLNLQIVDHGKGFDPATLTLQQISSGLSGMRERARLLNGEMVIESAPGQGTALSVRLPYISNQTNI